MGFTGVNFSPRNKWSYGHLLITGFWAHLVPTSTKYMIMMHRTIGFTWSFMVKVGKYTIHGSYGMLYNTCFFMYVYIYTYTHDFRWSSVEMVNIWLFMEWSLRVPFHRIKSTFTQIRLYKICLFTLARQFIKVIIFLSINWVWMSWRDLTGAVHTGDVWSFRTRNGYFINIWTIRYDEISKLFCCRPGHAIS